MKHLQFFSAAICLTLLVSCDKEENTEPTEDSTTLIVPDTYNFTNADGMSTVSYSGQEERLAMLGEMTAYLKSANTSGVALSADVLKDMYANEAYTWIDSDGLGMTGSSKQLKNKTAAANGTPDLAVQAYFEAMMDAIAGLSATTQTGIDNGGPGQGGVVVSSTNPSKQYLQSAEGVEYTQYIEKGLMGAVLYNQIVMDYLSDDQMDVDNTTEVDPDNGKYYTEMEHHWDEAYGYFTTATDYEAGGNGTDRFWGKYADSREAVLGSATSIGTAFRTGRAAIVAGDMGERDAQRTIIRQELAKVVAGTAIHYLNGSVADFTDDALRNHQLSEAVAFITALPYGHNPIVTQQGSTAWLIMLGNDFYNITTAQIIAVRDEIATAAGLSDVKEEL